MESGSVTACAEDGGAAFEICGRIVSSSIKVVTMVSVIASLWFIALLPVPAGTA